MMCSIHKMSCVLAILTWACSGAPGAVFQYTVPVATAKNPSSAFLWIPPEAKQVRGVLMGGMTLAEREMSKDPQIRKACAEARIAIVFLKCGLGGADIQKVLDDLAQVSGYGELSVAPLFFAGHSAGGPPAKALATKMAERCFGLMQYRGGIPGGAEPVPPGVPCLMMVGQFDEFGGTMRSETGRENPWEGGRDAIVAFRSQNEGNLASIVVEPGAGHFSWSDRNAAYLALFLKKAAAARIGDWAADAKEPVKCKAIDPKGGWLTDLTIRTPGEFAPAPYEQYRGDKARAAWHLDEEMAKATVSFHAGGFGKKDQFIKWSDPCWVDAGTRFFFTSIKWVGDGQTFEVHPVYADAYPMKKKPDDPGPRWAEAGKPVGHSNAPILVKQVSGPLVPTSPNTLRIQYDELAPATEAARPTFMAYSVGDDEFRYTEQVGMMPRGFSGLSGGKEQKIAFEPIGDLKADGDPVEIKATSDSGLKVEFHVGFGPALIEDGKLRIAEIPARAAFPIQVKVVAYQFGSGVAPQVKTAAPVEQTIQIQKP
jgi:hypothetical protein